MSAHEPLHRDVLVIGAGIAGCAVTYELMRYDLDVMLVERRNDIASEVTAANSGIVHGGYDPEPGTAMAYYNVWGNSLFPELAEHLHIPFRRIGSLVLAFNDDDIEHLKRLKERGDENGVPELRIIDQEELRRIEPLVSPEAVAALLSPTAGITGPWDLALAYAESATHNGAEIMRNAEVTALEAIDPDDSPIHARYRATIRCYDMAKKRYRTHTLTAGAVVNTAGLHADTIDIMLTGEAPYTIEPRRGDYYVLDKEASETVHHVLFRCPDEKGKGILLAPTVQDKVLVGPDSVPIDDKDDNSTTPESLRAIRREAEHSMPHLPWHLIIRNFAGLRPGTAEKAFRIGRVDGYPGYYHVAGFESPGLTAAPAVGRDIARMVAEDYVTGPAEQRRDFDPGRPFRPSLKALDDATRAAMIARDPEYGRMVCRCETVTRGEIRDAIRGPVGARSIKGVKYRTGAGLGRCQGAFCSPRILELLSEELGLPPEAILYDEPGSEILEDPLRAVPQDIADEYRPLFEDCAPFAAAESGGGGTVAEAGRDGASGASAEDGAAGSDGSGTVAGGAAGESDVDVAAGEAGDAESPGDPRVTGEAGGAESPDDPRATEGSSEGRGDAPDTAVTHRDDPPGHTLPEVKMSAATAAGSESALHDADRPIEAESFDAGDTAPSGEAPGLAVRETDLLIIGGGPAGLSAALAARDAGTEDILVLERDREPGGILQQCIHPGFGLKIFQAELTGPEYAQRFIHGVEEAEIPVLCDTMVTDLKPVTEDGRPVSPARYRVTTSSPRGAVIYEAKAVILAMGCRERTAGAIGVAGSRPAGVMTAGTAQRYINMEGYKVGKRAVILGSGDIGLIMARRLVLEGSEVVCVAEVMDRPGGLTRNIVQCLDDYDIPLLLSTTVVRIHGRGRIEAVTLAEVDDAMQPIPGTERKVACDTLLLSVGLIPENELSRAAGIELDAATRGPLVDESRETSRPGVFACGNVLHVHDLVDDVTVEARIAGRAAAKYLRALAEGRDPSEASGRHAIRVEAGAGVSAVVPQSLRLATGENLPDLYFRVREPMHPAEVRLMQGDRELGRWKRSRLTPGEMASVKLPKDLTPDPSAPWTLTATPLEGASS